MSNLAGSYKVSSVNGKKAEPGLSTLTLTASDGGNQYTVHAKAANGMNGKATFENGKLKGMLMSTMMMGSPEEMEVERILGKGFHEGMGAVREGNSLVLSVGNDKLVYESS